MRLKVGRNIPRNFAGVATWHGHLAHESGITLTGETPVPRPKQILMWAFKYSCKILLVLAALLFLCTGPARAQSPATSAEDITTATPVASDRPPRPVNVRAQNNLILVDDQPLTLLWARGLASSEEVQAYFEAGFNVIYAAVSSPAAAELAKAEEIMIAGEDRALPALVGLNSRAAVLDENGQLTTAIDPHSADYQQSVRDFVGAVMPRFTDRPGLLGWIVEDLSPTQLHTTEQDFRQWLMARFQNIDNLNQYWQSSFTNFNEIGFASPAQVDAQQVAGLGRANIDLGIYYFSLYYDLLDLWAGELNRADAKHLIILGGQPDFRSLAAAPGSYNGIITQAFTPQAAPEGGFVGIEAIDMARRANRFASFAFANAQALSPAAFFDWAGQALVHGAAGLGLDNWPAIKNNAALQEAVKHLRQLTISAGAFPHTPQAEAAFLYMPLAGGDSYSFMPQPPSWEPGVLFSEFGRGTRFGQFDYLVENMLSGADLSRYKIIFAPLAFTLSSASQQALTNYVNNGGLLVADWGIGVHESGTLNYLPTALADLFGVSSIFAVNRTPLDILVNVDPPNPLFPSLPFQAQTTGRRLGGAFTGLVGDATITEKVTRFMTIYAWSAFAPSIFLNQVGAGTAVFASAPLWENWQRGDSLFAEFHGDLIGRQPSVATRGSGLFSAEDVALYADGAVGLFRTSASSLPALVESKGDANMIYQVYYGLQLVGQSNPTFLFGGLGPNIALPTSLSVKDVVNEAVIGIREGKADKLVLEIHGAGPTFGFANDQLLASGGADFSLTLVIPSDEAGYSFASGSRHNVTIVNADTNKNISTSAVTAAGTTIELPITGQSVLVTIEPIVAVPKE